MTAFKRLRMEMGNGMLGIRDNTVFLPAGVVRIYWGLVLCINWNVKRMGTFLVMHLQMSLLHTFAPYWSREYYACSRGCLLSSHLPIFSHSRQAGLK